MIENQKREVFYVDPKEKTKWDVGESGAREETQSPGIVSGTSEIRVRSKFMPLVLGKYKEGWDLDLGLLSFQVPPGLWGETCLDDARLYPAAEALAMDECRHIEHLQLARSHSIFNPQKWLCVDCSTTQSLWACLSCSHIACGRHIAEHALKRFQESSHPVEFEVNDMYVFCYLCNDYVLNDTAAGDLKSLRSTFLFRMLPNLKYTYDGLDSNTGLLDDILQKSGIPTFIFEQ